MFLRVCVCVCMCKFRSAVLRKFQEWISCRRAKTNFIIVFRSRVITWYISRSYRCFCSFRYFTDSGDRKSKNKISASARFQCCVWTRNIISMYEYIDNKKKIHAIIDIKHVTRYVQASKIIITQKIGLQLRDYCSTRNYNVRILSDLNFNIHI